MSLLHQDVLCWTRGSVTSRGRRVTRHTTSLVVPSNHHPCCCVSDIHDKKTYDCRCFFNWLWILFFFSCIFTARSTCMSSIYRWYTLPSGGQSTDCRQNHICLREQQVDVSSFPAFQSHIQLIWRNDVLPRIVTLPWNSCTVIGTEAKPLTKILQVCLIHSFPHFLIAVTDWQLMARFVQAE